MTPFSAGAALKKTIQRCEKTYSKLIAPESLRATLLRKHACSMAIAAGLTDAEVRALCRFMGHTYEVHNRFYVLPIRAEQVARLGEYFNLVNGQQGKVDF